MNRTMYYRRIRRTTSTLTIYGKPRVEIRLFSGWNLVDTGKHDQIGSVDPEKAHILNVAAHVEGSGESDGHGASDGACGDLQSHKKNQKWLSHCCRE